jgi:GNAT superfamily N-acetyltransferase
MSPNPTPAFLIRKARETDCPAIASLTVQLGYPSSTEDVCKRLKHILASEGDVVFLAHSPDKRVTGWIHAYLTTILETDPYAEIGGLVVDESMRNQGVGTALVKEVERWTIEQDVGLVRVRSNIIREKAHTFYRKRGYERTKTQHVYLKQV